MPLYEYTCAEHGLFDELRPYRSANLPALCPACGSDSPRVMSVPRVPMMDKTQRIGMERNEKSRHEPHVCSAGCRHGHRKPQKQEASSNGKRRLHAYTGPRPWVVEHA